jgi:hypothetical protein
MNIEAVTVCVGYADFLAQTAKWNAGLFDHWTIITEPRDHDTREVCRRFNLRTLMSEDGKLSGDFAKGRMIERALQHTAAEGWRLHLDADIALPHCFRQRLLAAQLQKDTIYGVDRVMLKSYPAWVKLQASGYLQGGQFDYHCRTNIPEGSVLGTRWCHPQQGYVPIGYFQLWHSSEDEWRGVRVKPYPSNHGNACRTDVQFALQWDRHKRQVIPELFGVHLESEPSPRGANWNGRTSAPFGPSLAFEQAALETRRIIS